MTYKIKCTYVAPLEPFTLDKKYTIYLDYGGFYYIKNDDGVRTGSFSNSDTPIIDRLIDALGDEYHSLFTPCITLEEEPEKDIKKEVHNLLDKATELIYNNQEELKIDYMDFITLVKIKEELK